jgi:Leucine-rich repeat (LRR) protein
LSTIRSIACLLLACILIAGCNKKGGKLPRTKLPAKPPEIIQEDAPAAPDLDQEVNQLYETDWRNQRTTTTPALEAATARAKSALEELVKAGAKVPSAQRIRVKLTTENLDADGTIKADVLAQLRLAGVEELDLDVIPITDSGMLQLKTLLCLKEVRVLSQKITDAGFEGFEPLKSIEQIACFAPPGSPPLAITGEGFKYLERLPNLKTFDVRRAAVNGGYLAYLSRVPNITNLYLDENKLTDLAIVHLRTLSRLKYLSLDKNQIAGTGLKELAGLNDLGLLSLNHCPVTNAGMEAIALLKLNQLSLNGTKLTDAAAGAIAKIRTLKSLHLSYTGVTNVGVASLAGLPELQEIELRGDNITDAVLLALSSCPKLQTVLLTKTRLVTLAAAFKWEKSKPGVEVKFFND